MARLSIFLLISSMMLSGAFSQTTSSPPLSSDEKRIILELLYRLKAQDARVITYEEFIAKEKERTALERENYERAISLEKQATALAERGKEIERERGDMWKRMYDSVTEKRTFGCWVKMIFTFGLARCR